MLVVALEETEVRNYCAGDGLRQFKQPPILNEFFHISHNMLYRFCRNSTQNSFTKFSLLCIYFQKKRVGNFVYYIMEHALSNLF
jgi:hypothetical protein